MSHNKWRITTNEQMKNHQNLIQYFSFRNILLYTVYTAEYLLRLEDNEVTRWLSRIFTKFENYS